MATPANVDADLKSRLGLLHGRQADDSAQPYAPSSRTHRTHRRLRRIISREQGRALEMIGHAVDYLNDCYLHEGADDEILDFRDPRMDAVRILVSAQRQIHRSLPLIEPLPLRLWHALLRRKSQYKSAAVVPLSSSR